MIAKDNKKETKMENVEKESIGTTKIEPEEEVKAKAQKIVNDDYQVILDDRGLYKVGDKWGIKIRRINVQEMIRGWAVISSVFGNVATMPGIDLNDPQAWIMMFITATTVVPGKFYMFLAQIMELQYDEGLPQKELKKLRDEYNNYLRFDLKTEELMDVLGIIYKQEEKRIDELVKKAQSLFAPFIAMMKKRAEKEKMEAAKKAMETLKK